MAERFLRVPHIRQRAEADCLVACAAMLLEFAGFHFGYDRLMRLFGTTSFGTPHSRIQLLPRLDPNLHLIYQEGAIESLIYLIAHGTPVGIFVATEELPYWTMDTSHAVVIVGYSDVGFYLHDPALADAPTIVSHGDLQLAWYRLDSMLFVVQRVR